MRRVITTVLQFKKTLQEKSSAKRFEIGGYLVLEIANIKQTQKKVIKILQRKFFPEELRILKSKQNERCKLSKSKVKQ